MSVQLLLSSIYLTKFGILMGFMGQDCSRWIERKQFYGHSSRNTIFLMHINFLSWFSHIHPFDSSSICPSACMPIANCIENWNRSNKIDKNGCASKCRVWLEWYYYQKIIMYIGFKQCMSSLPHRSFKSQRKNKCHALTKIPTITMILSL